MSEILHLIIKKDYAASLIQHLQKENAIEIIEEDVQQIPEWQKEAKRSRLTNNGFTVLRVQRRMLCS